MMEKIGYRDAQEKPTKKNYKPMLTQHIKVFFPPFFGLKWKKGGDNGWSPNPSIESLSSVQVRNSRIRVRVPVSGLSPSLTIFKGSFPLLGLQRKKERRAKTGTSVG